MIGADLVSRAGRGVDRYLAALPLTASQRRVARAMALGLAISVAIVLLSRVGHLAGWETWVVDRFLVARDRVTPPDIVVVAIDEEAFVELEERQPLSRRYLAELGQVLLDSGARAVGFDVVVSRATEAGEDAQLLELVRRAGGRVVLATTATPAPGAPSRHELAPPFAPALVPVVAFANTPVGGDGIIRHMTPVLPAPEGRLHPSFALAVLGAAAGSTPRDLGQRMGAGSSGALAVPAYDRAGRLSGADALEIDTLARHRWRIDFVGPPGTFTAFPASTLVRLARQGLRAEVDNPFRDRIVLVGATFEASRDFYPTPLGRMAGVEIQANMVHTLLARRALLPPHWLVSLTLLVGSCLAVAALSLWLRPRLVTLAMLGLVAVLYGIGYEAYRRGYWLDVVAPIAAMKMYMRWSGKLARRRMKEAFGQYVSPEVVAQIVRDGAHLDGEMRTVSVLMSDLRGFTTLSERLGPERIAAVIDAYLEAMVDVIMQHRGVVLDFIGDGILAVFGAPIRDDGHAWNAVTTASRMQDAFASLAGAWEAQGLPPLVMGVAVNTGEVFAGTVGSKRKKYAVVGDPVNTVSRMEGLNRDLGTRILLSGATCAAVRDRVIVRERGAMPVKGRAEAVEVWELVGLHDDAAHQALTAASYASATSSVSSQPGEAPTRS